MNTASKPDNNITRAELAAVLHRIAQKESLFCEIGMANAAFNDINGHWAYEDIMQLAYKGIVQGYEDGSFGPKNNVTRAETVVMAARLFGRTAEFGTDKTFSDVLSAHWAYAYFMNALNGR